MRSLVAVTAAVALGLLGAPGAHAATVAKSGTLLAYTAATAEVNTVAIDRVTTTYRVIDQTAPVTAGAGCTRVSLHRARCDAAGIDLVRVVAGDRDDTVTVTGSTKADLRGGTGTDSLTGGAGADTLTAGSGPQMNYGATEYLTGSGGADTLIGSTSLYTTVYLNGGPGADDLQGGASNDYMTGGPGADDFSGGGGTDEVRYFVATTRVTASFDDVANDGAAGEHDNLGSDIRGIRGGSGNDVLTGNAAANLLDGGTGNDVLRGMGGDDSLDGGSGADTLYGGLDDDTFNAGTEADTVSGGNGIE